MEKTIIILLQFAKNRMSISSKLRPQEEVKNVSSKRNTLYFCNCIYSPIKLNQLKEILFCFRHTYQSADTYTVKVNCSNGVNYNTAQVTQVVS